MLASAKAPGDVEAMMLGGADGASMQSGFYLQLGAYTRAEAAEAVRDKLSAAAPDDNFEVMQVGAVYRLYGGPHATRKDAQQASKRIPSALRLKPLVIQR
ncbi:SPOR domain-containing protein [Pseudoduganella sp. UC29_106]|uniref:SPOR domain-containing protein n=1 Tax=Pseudoduganella sp. UC29_106 TaxID=3374553 RepID=UPI0037578B40